MPWLIDGNNVAAGGDRARVRESALALVRHEKLRIVLFFDGVPPPGVPAVERLGRVEVRYAADADRAIVAFLRDAGHGWRVVTDDRELARRSRLAGADVVPGAAFLAKAATVASREPVLRGAVNVKAELEYFADADNRLASGTRRLSRRTPRSRPVGRKGST
jgi:hypothetical protein